jgi:magnesium-transporting ATPase (P-type)
MQLTSSTERSASGSAGLSSADAERRLADVGPNTLAEEKGPSPARQLAANFVQPLALLLWACAGLALLADMPELSVAIAAVIVINALFSFFEEYKAERAVSELRRLLPSQVHVRRDGAAVDVPSENVVPGDVLLLQPGDRVAADADLLTATDMRVDESALTGESTPVEPEEQVYAGTFVTAGSGEALVTATGMRTRFGRIAGIGSLEGLAAMASFLFAYVLAGWRPWQPLAGHGQLYREATTMTMAGIMFAQIGAGMAWRTTRESIRTIGLFSNRMLLAGIAVEVAVVALLAYTPGLQRVFHTSGLSGEEWLFLLVWPPLVLGAEELRKAVVRRRRP